MADIWGPSIEFTNSLSVEKCLEDKSCVSVHVVDVVVGVVILVVWFIVVAN